LKHPVKYLPMCCL